MAGIIVIGASAGGVVALQTLVADLPAGLSTPVAIVLHIGAHRSRLVQILRSRTSLAVEAASEGARLAPATIYVAPSDLHLVIDGNVMHTCRGPRQNLSRPAIDPLFRSAAKSFGPAAIGVILTGRLNDGTAGLFEIKRRGGVAVVQDPATAEQQSMPLSALEHVDVDHVVGLDKMGSLLGRLAAAANAPTLPKEGMPMQEESRFKAPIAFACPDCGGALEREHDAGNLLNYRCHIGHKVTGQILASHQMQAIEYHVEAAVRLLHEGQALARDFQQAARKRGDVDAAKSWNQSEGKISAALNRVLMLSEELPSPIDVETS